jgi:hypothetical protein
LSEVLIDCVEGGASVSFMLPMSRKKAEGWQRCGEIPNYALWPDGRLCPTTIFYKALTA